MSSQQKLKFMISLLAGTVFISFALFVLVLAVLGGGY